MHEIDLMIMKNVIQDNNMDFFYLSCLTSDDLQYELWEDVIHVIFDESQTVWFAGNKEEALMIYVISDIHGCYDELKEKMIG